MLSCATTSCSTDLQPLFLSFRHGPSPGDTYSEISRTPDDYRVSTFEQGHRGLRPSASRGTLADSPQRDLSSANGLAQRLHSSEGVVDGPGTWAERQKIFSHAANEEEGLQKDTNNGHVTSTPATTEEQPRIAYAASMLAGSSGSRQATQDELQQNRSAFSNNNNDDAAILRSTSSEDADMNAAWRWRFTRKWQQEQLRQIDGAASVGGNDEDDWSTALDYMAAAVSGGLNLQFGRTTSGECDPSLSQSGMLLEASMSRGDSLSKSQGTGGMLDNTPMASRRIALAVHKAEQLMAHQEEIERQVAERWNSAEQPWAAQSIPAVNIDSWGTFPFILARVMDMASGRQKLLIRGRNRFQVKQAEETLLQEVTAEALNRRLSVPKIDVLGSGRIEWSRERDRCLTITGSAVHSALDTRLKRKEDVGRVAAALARTGLPALHTVIVSDGRQSTLQAGTRSSHS